MKKILKKLLTAMCALVLCVVCFTGCSWLELDKGKYYNQIVVTVGDKEYTKKDLLDAFSNYGYQYYQSYGLSLEESVNKTITSMIDRDLLMNVVKEEIGELTQQEQLQIKKQAFDYMQDSIDSYEESIRKEWKQELTFEESKTSESLRKTEESYSPTTIYSDGVVTRVSEKEEEIDVPEDMPEHFSKDYRIITDKKICDEAWTRYVKSLQDMAKSEGRSTKESDVLLAEENRLLTLLSNNVYLDKFEQNFIDNLEVDTSSVLKYYKEQYNSQRELYTSSKTSYHTAMKDAAKNYIYYHPNSGNEYVNVKHILINFNQEQKDLITSLNTEFGVAGDNSESDTEIMNSSAYKSRLNNIIASTKSTFEMSEDLYMNYGINYNFEKVNGKDNTYTAKASDIYRFVQNYVSGTFKQKSIKFNELVYVFNDDEGFMNSEFDYVVNLDTSVTDQMVKPFADGVRALDESNGGEGAGSMDMIVSTYGYHIIFHDGVAENLIDEYNIDNVSDAQLLAILCLNYTTPDSNKSIFNFIYDTLNLDENKYDNMTQEIVKNERTKLKNNNIVITYYEKRYKDLWD